MTALKLKIRSDANCLQIVIRLQSLSVLHADSPGEISRQRSGRTSNSRERNPFNWIKRKRNENLHRMLADWSESNQRETLIYLELSVDISQFNTILKLSRNVHWLFQTFISITVTAWIIIARSKWYRNTEFISEEIILVLGIFSSAHT